MHEGRAQIQPVRWVGDDRHVEALPPGGSSVVSYRHHGDVVEVTSYPGGQVDFSHAPDAQGWGLFDESGQLLAAWEMLGPRGRTVLELPPSGWGWPARRSS